MKTLTEISPASAVRSAGRSLCAAVVCLASLSVGLNAQTPSATVDSLSVRSGVAFTRTSYDYVPAIMKQGDYKMWWCGGVAGDYILYAESNSVAGPWHSRGGTTPNTKDTALQPTNNHQSFDSAHTCDPSVILWKGKYYLYYGGLPQADDTAYTSLTRFGVAQSDDGATGFTRQNGGAPIVSPIGTPASAAWVSGSTYVRGDQVLYLGKTYVCTVLNTSSTIDPAANTTEWRKQYGAGQPAVVSPGDGWIYMFFTDSTGSGSGVITGAGIYVIRSSDPTFQTNTEELQSTGWVSIGDAGSRSGSYVIRSAFSVDVVYSDVLQNFIIASNQTAGQTNLYFFSDDLLSYEGMLTLSSVSWTEGPGIVRGPEGRALPGDANNLDRIPIDLIFSYQVSGTSGTSGWDLYHVGYDLVATITQTDLNARVGDLFRGWKVQASGLPLTYVTSESTRLQCQSSGAPDLLTNNLYSISSTYFYTIPFGAVLPTGATVWGATARPAAFIMNYDTRLWPVNDGALITANGSSITTVSQATYDAEVIGPALYLTDW